MDAWKKLVTDYKADFIDLKFTDLFGLWNHLTLPIARFSKNGELDWEDLFREGIGFDGSSIRGFQEIDESDMLLKPERETLFLDPFADEPTVSFICDIKDPMTSSLYSRDPRHIAKKAERYLKGTGIADIAYFGPEAEFFIFDTARFEQDTNRGFYEIDSAEGAWNRGVAEVNGGKKNQGYRPKYKGGYVPCAPVDSLLNLRSKMVLAMQDIGVEVEVHHHEVATAGQSEIGIRYNTLVTMADSVMKYKYVVKNIAYRCGKTATFMPKPLFGDNGSGMHTHQSLWKGGKNLFYQPSGYAGLSDLAKYYIGGILYHAPSLLALCAPATNSYKRLVPGYEAPVNLIYSQRNRSAAIRIPTYSHSENAKRIEFRCPDPSCNPYLAFSAMLMAGLDGIERHIVPPEPIDKDLYHLEPEEKAKVKSTPGSLEESLAALEADHEYLLKGGVFTSDVIEMWLSYKRKHDVDSVRLRPHPYEFLLYYDA